MNGMKTSYRNTVTGFLIKHQNIYVTKIKYLKNISHLNNFTNEKIKATLDFTSSIIIKIHKINNSII